MLKDRLVQLRKRKKKTQEDIAKVVEVTRPAYTAYERGTRNPDYGTLQKLADYFDVSTDYLLGRTDDPNGLNIHQDEFEDPELDLWFKELKEASPERREELKRFWDFIKDKDKERKPGDKQGE